MTKFRDAWLGAFLSDCRPPRDIFFSLPNNCLLRAVNCPAADIAAEEMSHWF